MKIKYIAIVGIIFLIFVSLFLFFYIHNIEKIVTEKEMEGVVFRSYFSVQGYSTTITLFDTMAFIEDRKQVDTGKSCYTGILSKEEYEGFVSYLRNTGIMTKKIYQKDDSKISCDGFSSISMSIDGKIHTIKSICVDEYSKESRETFALANDIEENLKELLKKTPKNYCFDVQKEQ